ncbi:MAG: transposase [Pseudonocardiales bacterium]|nr:transposase [Pseudonocardiales bacterium]
MCLQSQIRYVQRQRTHSCLVRRTQRHRLNRRGNRRLNRALYIIAITQARADHPGRDYLQRKQREGKSRREALRCLKRRISDAVYRCLVTDATTAETSTT